MVDAVAFSRGGSLRIGSGTDRRVKEPIRDAPCERFPHARSDEGMDHIQRRDAATTGEANWIHDVASAREGEIRERFDRGAGVFPVDGERTVREEPRCGQEIGAPRDASDADTEPGEAPQRGVDGRSMPICRLTARADEHGVEVSVLAGQPFGGDLHPGRGGDPTLRRLAEVAQPVEIASGKPVGGPEGLAGRGERQQSETGNENEADLLLEVAGRRAGIAAPFRIRLSHTGKKASLVGKRNGHDRPSSRSFDVTVKGRSQMPDPDAPRHAFPIRDGGCYRAPLREAV